MKPKIKRKNWFVKLITGKRIRGITLAPFGIYLRDDVYNQQNERTINHEKIHWQQQMELLILPFYIIYFVEWLIRLFLNGRDAYNSISFEREAYANDEDMEYLKTRKRFSWFKYMRD